MRIAHTHTVTYRSAFDHGDTESFSLQHSHEFTDVHTLAYHLACSKPVTDPYAQPETTKAAEITKAIYSTVGDDGC